MESLMRGMIGNARTAGLGSVVCERHRTAETDESMGDVLVSDGETPGQTTVYFRVVLAKLGMAFADKEWRASRYSRRYRWTEKRRSNNSTTEKFNGRLRMGSVEA